MDRLRHRHLRRPVRRGRALGPGDRWPCPSQECDPQRPGPRSAEPTMPRPVCGTAAAARAGAVGLVAHRRRDRWSEAVACTNLGRALSYLGQETEAIDARAEAHALVRDISDRQSEAEAMHDLGNGLGLAPGDVRDAEQPIEAHTPARDLIHELGDRVSEASVWIDLGAVLVRAERRSEVPMHQAGPGAPPGYRQPRGRRHEVAQPRRRPAGHAGRGDHRGDRHCPWSAIAGRRLVRDRTYPAPSRACSPRHREPRRSRANLRSGRRRVRPRPGPRGSCRSEGHWVNDA
ncbi:hypothetical protein S1361_01465 [Streptomyces cyanogenus]|uniref:Tetratricopeptide repeat protein n=1 Tax=Streptomyces cyanogenus TaxID=80860 RepID=A0ABX7THS5_STRCY|nr:hypothetical protein S1361_01465 [Streptomyces cyanogenus]